MSKDDGKVAVEYPNGFRTRLWKELAERKQKKGQLTIDKPKTSKAKEKAPEPKDITE